MLMEEEAGTNVAVAMVRSEEVVSMTSEGTVVALDESRIEVAGSMAPSTDVASVGVAEDSIPSEVVAVGMLSVATVSTTSTEALEVATGRSSERVVVAGQDAEIDGENVEATSSEVDGEAVGCSVTISGSDCEASMGTELDVTAASVELTVISVLDVPLKFSVELSKTSEATRLVDVGMASVV